MIASLELIACSRRLAMLIRLTIMAPLSLSSLPGTPTADSHQQPTTISLAGEGRAKTSVAFCRKLGTYASGLVCLNWPGHYPPPCSPGLQAPAAPQPPGPVNGQAQKPRSKSLAKVIGDLSAAVLTDQRFEDIERASKIFQSSQLKCPRFVTLIFRRGGISLRRMLRFDGGSTADPNPVEYVGDQSRLKTFPRDDHRCGTAVVCSDGDSSRQGRSAN